ncbi:diacylglycerol kinase family protein [Archangium sp.]|uniref:diacylglycerol/lipid kinase family protein n=1 Tax=Archangium sp. TaxID=1872627 RepID=UPI002869FBAA|nr:diacylglycerol kinase family protein [Archangium sp.]
MLVQPLRSVDPRQVPSVSGSPENKVAVLLNANARQVDARVVKSLSHVVPEQDLFLSRSELDCKRIIQTVLERNYPVVFTGGGDGTFQGFVNEVFRQLEPRSRFAGKRAPRFGVLKLGTGNGLASYLNAGAGDDGILQDVVRARTGEVPGYKRMDLLLVDGKRTAFAGLGVDGKLLNDYIWVKSNLAKGLLKKVMSGPGGYFSAVALKTVPHYLMNSTWVECEITNGRAGEAYRVGPDGKPMGAPIAPGQKLFQGRLMMAAAATMPYYGYGFRMFPFAGERRGMMHLRLGQLHAPNVLANLPKLWAGRWFPEGIKDFYAQEVHIRFATAMPFQLGGDAAGYRQDVKLSVAPEPVELVDFHGSMH